MILIPFSNFTKQKLNLFLDNKNLEISIYNIKDSYYIDIHGEDRIYINGMRLPNLYPIGVGGIDGYFLLDKNGESLGVDTFVYFITKEELQGLKEA